MQCSCWEHGHRQVSQAPGLRFLILQGTDHRCRLSSSVHNSSAPLAGASRYEDALHSTRFDLHSYQHEVLINLTRFCASNGRSSYRGVDSVRSRSSSGEEPKNFFHDLSGFEAAPGQSTEEPSQVKTCLLLKEASAL